MADLLAKHCVPCDSLTKPFTRTQAESYLPNLPNWELSDDAEKISRKFKFQNFAEALAFVNRVGAIAETENHHPNVKLGWGYAKVEISTHAIGGLSENDFILAAKINQI